MGSGVARFRGWVQLQVQRTVKRTISTSAYPGGLVLPQSPLSSRDRSSRNKAEVSINYVPRSNH